MELGLVILDGWGLNSDEGERDAISAANTPHFDRLRTQGAFGTLTTHGTDVGLPAGQMGNSEVGHLNIGAGRVVTQESARITDSIARWRDEASTFESPIDPPLDENPVIREVFESTRERGKTVHLLGLVSDGGVHSYQAHIHALIDLAAECGVESTTHAFTDGRDTAPRSGREFIAELQAHANSRGTGTISTVTGRYYAMDRDENWDRTRLAYDAIVHRDGVETAPTAVSAVEQSYENDITDEFIEPWCIDGGKPVSDGDAVIFVNFRADRARQLTRMLADIEPEWTGETQPPEITVTTMTEYDETFQLPVAFPPNYPDETLGEVLSEHGYTQLRIAETEKYAHVTYFLNGGKEAKLPGERREIVPSPPVTTYDQQPEMSASEVTATAAEIIETDNPDVVVLNYANPDMVGHTGNFDAAVKAVEAVDTELGRLVEAIQEAGGKVIITADHGNADEMGTPEQPQTAHTTNPVPFVYLDSDGTAGGLTVREGGILADIAPTILSVLTLETPAEMTGRSLLDPVS